MACWILGLILVVALTVNMGNMGFPAIPILGLGAELGLFYLFSIHGKMRGFLPGMILGIVLSCLLPFAAIVAICGFPPHFYGEH